MRLQLFSLVVPLVLLSPALSQGVEPPDLKPLVTRANVLLTAGQFHDAAKSLSEAIELSPADYSLYYKRATAYYSLSRHSAALEDLETILRMTEGSFHQAFLMKARILAREGDWSRAKTVLKKYTAKAGKGDKDGAELLSAVSESETAHQKAIKAQRQGNWEGCGEEASKAIHTASHSIPLRQMRADCSLLAGDLEASVGDLTRLSHLIPSSTKLLLRVAHIAYYLLNQPSQAMSALKQCLHHDPDDKPCRKSHRLFKSFGKEFDKLDKAEKNNDWRGVLRVVAGYKDSAGLLKDVNDALDAAIPSMELPKGADAKTLSGARQTLYKATCRAYSKDGRPQKAVEWCDEVLKMDENDLDALVNRGDLALSREEWDEAVRAFEKAFEASGRSSQEIQQKLHKAHRLLKQSQRKDYYKVLSVARDADDRTIKKAYRTKAREAHPDKGGSEEKMAAVNEAYEVLSDPELRARFDNGDDPNDPDSARGHPFQQGGGHPFFFQQQGGFPGGGFPGGGFPGGGFPGGGGGQFHFKFGG